MAYILIISFKKYKGYILNTIEINENLIIKWLSEAKPTIIKK